MDAPDEAQNDSMRTTLRNLITECDSLLGQLGDEGSRRYRNTVRAFDRQLQQARDDLDDLQYSAMRRARATIRRADAYVHENPYRTTAGAAATGLLLGAVIAFLLTRR
jgi:ElaB/YqjD/DUF883 family membrane-anchored ribosome-binding protein